MKLRIKFTKHSLDRMRQRNVSEEDVRNTIDDPTATFPKRPDNTQEFRRGAGNKINVVRVEHIKTGYVKILTTWWE
jgi:hypothetical protein